MSRAVPTAGRVTPTQESAGGVSVETGAVQLGMYVVEFPVVKPYDAAVFSSDQGFTADGDQIQPDTTVLMLNMDQSTPVDQASGGAAPHTVTAVGGVVADDTGSAFFGSGGVSYDGIDDGYTLADSADWDLLVGGADFFISTRARFQLDGTSVFFIVLYGDTTSDSWFCGVLDDGVGGRLKRLNFRVRVGGTYIHDIQTPNDVIQDNTWHEIAFARYDGTLYFYVDGAVVHSAAMAATNSFSGFDQLRIANATGAFAYDFEQDDLIIVKGDSVYNGKDYWSRDYSYDQFQNI